MVVLSQGKAKAKNRPNKFCSENVINVPMFQLLFLPWATFLGKWGQVVKRRYQKSHLLPMVVF